MGHLEILNGLYLADIHRSVQKIIPEPDAGARGVFTGLELLHTVFGKAWVQGKILTLKNRAMLQEEGPDFRDEAKLSNLIQMLGEGLFNLRCIPGFKAVLEKMANDSLDSALAEIESGRLLHHRGLNFRFVEPSGEKRKDYDIIIRDKGVEVNCETKCKMEGAKFSANSFLDYLSQAKKQLPLGQPSLIMIKVPSEWGRHDADLVTASQKMVKKTKRPIGVVCWREVWVLREDTEMKYINGFETHNEDGKLNFKDLLPILPKSPRDINWTDFTRFSDFLGKVYLPNGT